jgi:hypothetical protein
LIGLAIAIMGLISGSSRSDGAYKFYYYPKLNAYYDLDYNYFFYTLDGGKTWRKKPAIDDDHVSELKENIVLTENEKEIWKYNELHRKKYEGVVYDFTQRKDEIKRERSRNTPTPKKAIRRKEKINIANPEQNRVEASTSVETLKVEDQDIRFEDEQVKVKGEDVEDYIERKAVEELLEQIEQR